MTAPEGRWIEYMDVDKLVPALRNPRKHDLDRLRKSFRRFQFTKPPLLDERTGRLVAGHGRMQLLRHEHEAGEPAPGGVRVEASGAWFVPVTRGWTSADDHAASRMLLVDNALDDAAGWDDEVLLSELRHQAEAPGGLEGLGFDATDVDDLFAKLQERAALAPTPANQQHSQIRSLVLDYPLDDYRYVAETAHRARSHYGVESNAELFGAMLSEYAEATK